MKSTEQLAEELIKLHLEFCNQSIRIQGYEDETDLTLESYIEGFDVTLMGTTPCPYNSTITTVQLTVHTKDELHYYLLIGIFDSEGQIDYATACVDTMWADFYREGKFVNLVMEP